MLKFFFFIESEICDMKLTEARHNYAKRALKTLFNGSQKTFQVYRNIYIHILTYICVHIKYFLISNTMFVLYC